MLLAEIAKHPEAVEDALLGERLRWRDVAGGENANSGCRDCQKDQVLYRFPGA